MRHRGWLNWRNRLLASPKFQRWATRFVLTRAIGRQRAADLFDLSAGFVYSQTLSAVVEVGLLQLLAEGPRRGVDISEALSLSEAARHRLLRAAEALDLVEAMDDDTWALGSRGAALCGNPGALAMIRHNRLLYADLADPLALLRADRQGETALSRYWVYSSDNDPRAADYSSLMSASHAMVAEQVLASYPLGKHRALLDVGGGQGTFLRAVADAAPGVRLGVFDLPAVLAGISDDPAGFALHPGDFHRDPLPGGYDLITLVRVLHDHDDEVALALLRKVRESLPSGGRLLVAEPLAGTPGARPSGDAYFGWYLWAMGRGRPRRRDELALLLRTAGFRRVREARTPLPLIARVLLGDR